MKPSEVPGWCDFVELYRSFVNHVPGPAHFVEVGGWHGKSACQMGHLIKESGKRIRFDVIDHWKGSHTEKLQQREVEVLGGSDMAYFTFLRHVEQCGLADYVRPIRLPSSIAGMLYQNDSLDMVFIDGAHDYDSVKMDIGIWRPKVRYGGWIAGHDWPKVGVKDAVKELFGRRAQVDGSCWKVQKGVLAK